MPQREELTDVEKAQIVVLSHHENATEIGNELHIARCPVSSFYNDIININSLKIFPRRVDQGKPLPQPIDDSSEMYYLRPSYS